MPSRWSRRPAADCTTRPRSGRQRSSATSDSASCRAATCPARDQGDGAGEGIVGGGTWANGIDRRRRRRRRERRAGIVACLVRRRCVPIAPGLLHSSVVGRPPTPSASAPRHMPSSPDPLAVCEAAARAGGRVLEEWVGRFKATSKGPRDLVTEADHASQREIRRIVLERVSHARFRGRGRGRRRTSASSGSRGTLRIRRPLDRRPARWDDQLRARLPGLLRVRGARRR